MDEEKRPPQDHDRESWNKISRINSELTDLTRELERKKAQLERLNHELETEVARRKEAEEELRAIKLELEERVEARTTELSASNAELSAFVYAVAHELRSPLRAIDGFSAAVLEESSECLSDSSQEYVQRLRQGAQRMGKLMDELLDLFGVWRQDKAWQRVDLSVVARNMANSLQQREPGRRVEISIAETAPVQGDAGLLSMLMGELLDNAWKFTANNTLAEIAFGVIPGNGQTTYFVKDNGVGFDMQYADKLFVPFQRLHGAEEFPGNGIGLAKAERIVRRHHGRIWAESTIGNGATFLFSIGEATCFGGREDV